MNVIISYNIQSFMSKTNIKEIKHNLGQYFTTNIELKEKVYKFILNGPLTIYSIQLINFHHNTSVFVLLFFRFYLLDYSKNQFVLPI